MPLARPAASRQGLPARLLGNRLPRRHSTLGRLTTLTCRDASPVRPWTANPGEKTSLVATLVITICIIGISGARAANDCDRRFCPVVEAAPGALTAAYVSTAPGGSWVATNA